MACLDVIPNNCVKTAQSHAIQVLTAVKKDRNKYCSGKYIFDTSFLPCANGIDKNCVEAIKKRCPKLTSEELCMLCVLSEPNYKTCCGAKKTNIMVIIIPVVVTIVVLVIVYLIWHHYYG